LWRVAVAAAIATATARRNKGVWSSLVLGLSLVLSSDILDDSLGDTLSNYGASLRE
jgi:hypothetical protein